MRKEEINEHISQNITHYKLEAKSERLMGVLVPRLEAEMLENNDNNYDLLLTTTAFDELITQIKEIFSDLITLTSLESSISIFNT